jgi:hypothetical protein
LQPREQKGGASGSKAFVREIVFSADQNICTMYFSIDEQVPAVFVFKNRHSRAQAAIATVYSS